MSVTIPDVVVEVSGNAVREIGNKLDPFEAQVAMSLAIAYFCHAQQVRPETMTHVIVHNAAQLLDDAALRDTVFAKMHNRSADLKFLLPAYDAMVAKYPFRARVSDLPPRRRN